MRLFEKKNGLTSQWENGRIISQNCELKKPFETRFPRGKKIISVGVKNDVSGKVNNAQFMGVFKKISQW